jgi:hypothetical protein
MFRKISRKRSIAALSTIAVLAVAGAAYAYFTSTGTNAGTAVVGTSSPWTVTPAAATGGPLLPGSGTETITYTVTNASSGHQKLNTTTALVAAATNGDVTSAGNDVPGCLASWFTVSNTAPAAVDLAGAATTSGSLTVAMSNQPTSQDSCKNASPDITINAS